MQKPTTNNLQDDMRESVILRGIAATMSAMVFPKFKNLNQILLPFGYKVVSLNQENDIYEFLMGNRDKLQDIKNRYANSIKDGFNALNFSPFEKKLMLLENIIQSFLLKHDDKTESLPDHYNMISMRVADAICNHPRVAVAWMPIFRHNDHSYSVNTQKFDDIYKLIEFIYAINKDVAIYTIGYDYVGDPNPDSIYLKYVYLDKDIIGHKPSEDDRPIYHPIVL